MKEEKKMWTEEEVERAIRGDKKIDDLLQEMMEDGSPMKGKTHVIIVFAFENGNDRIEWLSTKRENCISRVFRDDMTGAAEFYSSLEQAGLYTLTVDFWESAEE